MAEDVGWGRGRAGDGWEAVVHSHGRVGVARWGGASVCVLWGGPNTTGGGDGGCMMVVVVVD